MVSDHDPYPLRFPDHGARLVQPVLEVDLRHDDRWATFSNGDGYYLPNTTKRGDG